MIEILNDDDLEIAIARAERIKDALPDTDEGCELYDLKNLIGEYLTVCANEHLAYTQFKCHN